MIEQKPQVRRGDGDPVALTHYESMEGKPEKKMTEMAYYESKDKSDRDPVFVTIYTETMARVTINGVHYDIPAGESRQRTHVVGMLENIYHHLKRL